MSTIEPRTNLSFWAPGAMQPDLVFNAMLYWIAVWAQAVVISVEDDPPGSPDEGDTYLVGTGTGAWSGQDDNVAYWDGFQWKFFLASDGYSLRNLDSDEVLVYSAGSGWAAIADLAEIGSYTIVTEGSAFTADPGTHDGLTTLTLAGGDVTFSDSEPYTEGMTFNIRATSPIELLEDSVTLDPPAGGTLELDAGMAVQVVFTDATTAVVIGHTVASP